MFGSSPSRLKFGGQFVLSFPSLLRRETSRRARPHRSPIATPVAPHRSLHRDPNATMAGRVKRARHTCGAAGTLDIAGVLQVAGCAGAGPSIQYCSIP